MRSELIGLAVLGGLVLAGCFVETVDCTTEAVGSVNLSVVDEGGAPVDGASATWSVDGGDPVDCEAMPGGSFVCGWEVEGAFTIAASAPGYRDATGEVTVGADECHVIPESLELVLEPGP